MSESKLIEMLKESPIKFNKNLVVVKEERNEELVALWVKSWLKGVVNCIVRKRFSFWKNLIHRTQTIKEVTIKVNPGSKYLKSNFIKVRLTELFKSICKSSLINLRFTVFKSMHYYSSQDVVYLNPLRNLVRLVLSSSIRYGFKVLIENKIKITYLDKELEIQSKLIRNRYKPRLLVLSSILKRRLQHAFNLMKKLKTGFPSISALTGAAQVMQIHLKAQQKLLFNLLKSY